MIKTIKKTKEAFIIKNLSKIFTLPKNNKKGGRPLNAKINSAVTFLNDSSMYHNIKNNLIK
jgi:hypothetical protein